MRPRDYNSYQQERRKWTSHSLFLLWPPCRTGPEADRGHVSLSDQCLSVSNEQSMSNGYRRLQYSCLRTCVSHISRWQFYYQYDNIWVRKFSTRVIDAACLQIFSSLRPPAWRREFISFYADSFNDALWTRSYIDTVVIDKLQIMQVFVWLYKGIYLLVFVGPCLELVAGAWWRRVEWSQPVLQEQLSHLPAAQCPNQVSLSTLLAPDLNSLPHYRRHKRLLALAERTQIDRGQITNCNSCQSWPSLWLFETRRSALAEFGEINNTKLD